MERKSLDAAPEIEVENEDAVLGTAVGTSDQHQQGVSTSDSGEPLEAENVDETGRSLSFVSRESESFASGGDGGASSSAMDSLGVVSFPAVEDGILEPEVDSGRGGESSLGGQGGDESSSKDVVDSPLLEVNSSI